MDEKPCPPNPLPNTTDYFLWMDVYEANIRGMNRPLRVEVEFGPERRVSKWTSKSQGRYRFVCDKINHEQPPGTEDPIASEPGKCQFRTIDMRLPMMISIMPH